MLSDENKYFIGIDIGSSFIKMSLYDFKNENQLDSISFPDNEMEILSINEGWAEQDPEIWWENIKKCFFYFKKKHDLSYVKSIGISYQMHGLVAIDKYGKSLFNSIIWCDSRSVLIGEEALNKLDKNIISSSLLNSPGNFTASKLRWVKENKPDVYSSIYKFMLPGDFIVFKLTGNISTTPLGLSEGIMWDFNKRDVSMDILDFYQIEKDKVPDIVPSIGVQGKISKENCLNFGLVDNVTISYRAGDQPNNAFSLNVLNDGEIAATAGTSAVIYCVTKKDISDPQNRVNTFLHCNDDINNKRNGVLLCINGSGIAYSWLKKTLKINSYFEMDNLSEEVNSSEGLSFFPFGNGSERLFNHNKNLNAMINGLDFNIHNNSHIIRSVLEGIAFSLCYGIEYLRNMGLNIDSVKVGDSNLFKSKIFKEVFVNVSKTKLYVYNTDGSLGAARGAALGSGDYNNEEEAFSSLKLIEKLIPQESKSMDESYKNWKKLLNKLI